MTNFQAAPARPLLPQPDSIDLATFRNSTSGIAAIRAMVDKVTASIDARNHIAVELNAASLIDNAVIFPLWSEHSWQCVMLEDQNTHIKQLNRALAHYTSAEDPSGEVRILRAFNPFNPDGLDNALHEHDIAPDLDLLVVNGNLSSYHVWRTLSRHHPRIVVARFNPTIPPHLGLSQLTNDPRVGCGVRDLLGLGNRLGYDLVACTDLFAVFVDKTDSAPFRYLNDLERHFVPQHLTYAISTHGGGLLLSRPPRHGYMPAAPGVRTLDPNGGFWYLPGPVRIMIAYLKQLMFGR